MLSALRATTCLFLLLLSQTLLSFAKSGISFVITVPASAHKGPITGRVFVVLSHKKKQSLLDDIGSWQQQTPFFASDIPVLAPGQSAIIGQSHRLSRKQTKCHTGRRLLCAGASECLYQIPSR